MALRKQRLSEPRQRIRDRPTLRPHLVFEQRNAAFEGSLRVPIPSDRCQELTAIGQPTREIRRIGPVLESDLTNTIAQFERPIVAPHFRPDYGQAFEAEADVRMVRAEALFLEMNGQLIKRYGVVATPLLSSHRPEVVRQPTTDPIMHPPDGQGVEAGVPESRPPLSVVEPAKQVPTA
jgi:hypothetical protein